MSGMSTELSMCIVYIATYIIIIMQMIIIHASAYSYTIRGSAHQIMHC